MDSFLTWLEDRANIHFTGWWNDGTIQVLINGKYYVYNADPIWHDKWRRDAQYAPGRVLNQIKQLVNNGQAKLISPKAQPASKSIQNTLF